MRRIDVLRDRRRIVDARLDAEQQVDLGALRRQIRLDVRGDEGVPQCAAVADGRDALRRTS